MVESLQSEENDSDEEQATPDSTVSQTKGLDSIMWKLNLAFAALLLVMGVTIYISVMYYL